MSTSCAPCDSLLFCLLCILGLPCICMPALHQRCVAWVCLPCDMCTHAMPCARTKAGVLGVQYWANLARQPRNYCAENLISPVHSISRPKVGCFFSAKDGEHAKRELWGQGREIWSGNVNCLMATLAINWIHWIFNKKDWSPCHCHCSKGLIREHLPDSLLSKFRYYSIFLFFQGQDY